MLQLDHQLILRGFYVSFLLIGIWGIVQAWLSQAHTETIHPWKAFIHLLAFYLSYLFIPLFVFNLYACWQGIFSTHESIFVGLLCTLFIYARFIEPHQIRVQYTSYQFNPDEGLKTPVRVVLIADLHIGLFSGKERQLQQIVNKINHLRPDMVLVAGDWTYEPEDRLADELAIFKHINVPIYSVNGNHDEQYPGPPIQALLQHALSSNHIVDIENKIVEFDEFRLIGVGDLWAGKTNMRDLALLPQDKPLVILSHNPDTVDMVPPLAQRPLMLSGHTHGGQVELPWITNYVMKKVSILGHKKGLYQHEHADVFVTVGTGMVGVPFRFRVPPTIELIELS